jgi:hypothetical protein
MQKTRNKSQIADLRQCIEITVRAEVECCICCEKYESAECEVTEQFPISQLEQDVAEEWFKAGWRYAGSDKFQVQGAMCPKCFKTPDKDRGEEGL